MNDCLSQDSRISSAASGSTAIEGLEDGKQKLWTLPGLGSGACVHKVWREAPGFDAEGSGFYRAGPLGACDFTHLCGRQQKASQVQFPTSLLEQAYLHPK